MFIENGDSPLLNQETQKKPENDSVAPSLSRIKMDIKSEDKRSSLSIIA